MDAADSTYNAETGVLLVLVPIGRTREETRHAADRAAESVAPRECECFPRMRRLAGTVEDEGNGIFRYQHERQCWLRPVES
jgi:hypothetical protein